MGLMRGRREEKVFPVAETPPFPTIPLKFLHLLFSMSAPREEAASMNSTPAAVPTNEPSGSSAGREMTASASATTLTVTQEARPPREDELLTLSLRDRPSVRWCVTFFFFVWGARYVLLPLFYCLLFFFLKYTRTNGTGMRTLSITKDSAESRPSGAASFTGNVPSGNHPRTLIMTRIEVVRAVAPAVLVETRRRRENTRRKLLDQEMERKFPTLRGIMHSCSGKRGEAMVLFYCIA